MTKSSKKRVAGDSLATRPGYSVPRTQEAIRPQVCDTAIMPQPAPKINRGQRFGRLTVIDGPLKKRESGRSRAYWLCRCDCEKTVWVRENNLKSGHTQSCGCLAADTRRHGKRFKYGNEYARKMRLYRIWSEMRYRCSKPTNKDFKYYGGRGIAVCAEWLYDFTSFREWAMSAGYQDDLTIDRIDVDGNYCPENCRWVTMSEQNKNHRKRHN